MGLPELRVLEELEKCKDVGCIMGVLESYEDKINFDASLFKKVISNIEEHGFSNILHIVVSAHKIFGKDTSTFLNKVFSIIEREFEGRFICASKKVDFYQFEKNFFEIGLDKLVDTSFLSNISHYRAIIFASKGFFKKVSGLANIFNKLFEGGEKLLPILAWDKKGIYWGILEERLMGLINFIPPLKDFVKIFHAFRFERDPRQALVEMDSLIRSRGLLTRTWSIPKSLIKHVENVVNRIHKLDTFNAFLKVCSLLVEEKVTIEEAYSFLIYSLFRGNRIDYLISNGFYITDGLLSVLEEKVDVESVLSEILDTLKLAEKNWFPEISASELIDIPASSKYDEEILSEWIKGRFEKIFSILERDELNFVEIFGEILPILKFLIILAVSKIVPRKDFVSYTIRYVLSLYNRLKYMPIVLISNFVKAVQILSEEEIGLALFLQRFLEVHGAKSYLKLLEDVLGDKGIYATYIGVLINSFQGIGPRKILAIALKSFDVIREIAKVSIRLKNYRPRGFTAPLPWELEVSFGEKVSKRISASLNFFQEIDSEPPRPLINLNNISKLFEEIYRGEESIKVIDFERLCYLYKKIVELMKNISELKSYLRKTFGFTDVKILRSIEGKVGEFRRIVFKEIERRYVANYMDLIQGGFGFVSDTLKLAKKYLDEGVPVILFVIDGVRYDDYLTKIKPFLEEAKFEIIEERMLLSHLPSITVLSRKSIFSLEKPPKMLVFPFKASKFKVETEGELLHRVYDKSLYIKGSIGEIRGVLRRFSYLNRLRGINLLVIVMSDLEKASHGSAEGFLAHMTMDYAREIVEIMKIATISYYQANNIIPIIILVSDHGLEKFAKLVDIDLGDLLNRIKRLNALDQAHEPLITPRYAIIPLTSGDQVSRLNLVLKREEKEAIWIKTFKELGIEKILMKVKGENLVEFVNGERVLIIVPRGDKRFRYGPSRSVVYHGGATPAEIIVPFAAFRLK